jgi:hypothetical protein
MQNGPSCRITITSEHARGRGIIESGYKKSTQGAIESNLCILPATRRSKKAENLKLFPARIG